MFSKFSHDLKQALPSSTSAESGSPATSTTAWTANRGHRPTTSNSSSFLTPSSLTESTPHQPDGERKEESETYKGKYHGATTAYEGKYQRGDAMHAAPATTVSTASKTDEEVIMTAALRRIVKHGYSLSWFKQRVFRYLGPNAKDTIELRSYCKLFRDALNPPPLWASFPNSKYKKLNQFMNKLNSVFKKDPSKAPKIVFVMEGTFHGNGSVNMNYPLMMIGAGRNKTFLDGYKLCIGGTKEEGKEVVVQDMTSSRAGWGLYASQGLSFLCKDM